MPASSAPIRRHGQESSPNSARVLISQRNIEAAESSIFEGRFWPLFALFAVMITIIAAICWSRSHPYGINWDESEYLNNVWIDLERLYKGNIVKLGGRLLLGSFNKPPAYRLLALPLLALVGFHTTMARLISLACFAVSSWFIYSTTSRISSHVAGAFAALVFALCPEVISASIFFGTDASLYLATSAMLYYLIAHWTDATQKASTWIGLGLAIGLGLWAKASFVLIGPPVLAFAFVVDYHGSRRLRSLVPLCKSVVLGVLIGAPWWLVNGKHAVVYARYARGFVRDSLGPPSLATWVRWLNTVLQALLGHGISIFIFLVIIMSFRQIFIRKQAIFNTLQKNALGACMCAGLPIVVSQLSGINHLLRHISPSIIPLAIAVGVLSDAAKWARAGISFAASIVLFSVQLLMILYPVLLPNKHAVDLGFVNGSLPWRAMARFDQWNWNSVRDISDNCGLKAPHIAYLGSGREFDPPAIQYPWVPSAITAFPDVTWLWRYEDGPLDWSKVMAAADRSDIVLTAPHYIGEVRNKENLDNHYNTEFADRLSQDPLFRAPIRLQMGRFEPIEVDLFLKTTVVCNSH